MTARSATLREASTFWRGAGAGRPPWLPNPRLTLGDTALAAALTGFALITQARTAHPVPAGVLACAGTMSLAWRRQAPVTVLMVSAAGLAGEKLLTNPRTVLSIAVLVALYTLAATYRTLHTAAAAVGLLAGAVACDVARHGWLITDFDDQFFAYLMAIGAACTLGYAVQLSRTRLELMQAREARLEAEQAGREQLLLQREHARIARELHDVIAHQVCLITALAAGAERVVGAEPQRAQQVLSSIEAAGRAALTEMRALLRVLRAEPDSSPQPGLAQLPSLAERMTLAGLPVRLGIDGPQRPLPAAVEVAGYRIVQEALTNSLKHAGPAQAEVLVRYGPDGVELDVRDDGRGIAAATGLGHGLIGMRERAALTGGRLLVGPGPAGGTRVVATLPAAAAER